MQVPVRSLSHAADPPSQATDGTASYAGSTAFSGAYVRPANTRVYNHADGSQALRVTLQFTRK